VYKCAASGKPSDPYVNKVLGKADPEPEKKEEKKEIKPKVNSTPEKSSKTKKMQ